MIGNRTMFNANVRTGANSVDTELDWHDANVQVFQGTGYTDVQLPTADGSNSYGECWIVNSQADGEITISRSAEGGTVGFQVLNDVAIVLTPGEAAICRYVPNVSDSDASDPKPGTKRGGWIVLPTSA